MLLFCYSMFFCVSKEPITLCFYFCSQYPLGCLKKGTPTYTTNRTKKRSVNLPLEDPPYAFSA